MKTNFLQTGDYHCFICHKTTPNGCAHLTVATNEFPTTPCVEACGKYYRDELKELEGEEIEEERDIIPDY